MVKRRNNGIRKPLYYEVVASAQQVKHSRLGVVIKEQFGSICDISILLECTQIIKCKINKKTQLEGKSQLGRFEL